MALSKPPQDRIRLRRAASDPRPRGDPQPFHRRRRERFGRGQRGADRRCDTRGGTRAEPGHPGQRQQVGRRVGAGPVPADARRERRRRRLGQPRRSAARYPARRRDPAAARQVAGARPLLAERLGLGGRHLARDGAEPATSRRGARTAHDHRRQPRGDTRLRQRWPPGVSRVSDQQYSRAQRRPGAPGRRRMAGRNQSRRARRRSPFCALARRLLRPRAAARGGCRGEAQGLRARARVDPPAGFDDGRGLGRSPRARIVRQRR